MTPNNPPWRKEPAERLEPYHCKAKLSALLLSTLHWRLSSFLFTITHCEIPKCIVVVTSLDLVKLFYTFEILFALLTLSYVYKYTFFEDFNTILYCYAFILPYIYMGRDLGKPGFKFHFSTFSITDNFYDRNARRIMMLPLLIIKLWSFF